MTNFEYYKEQLKNLAGKKIGVFDGKPNRCAGRKCSECDLDNCNQERYSDNCEYALTQWYLDEHVEKPTITKKEKTFLELCKPDLYIARDRSGGIFIYETRPRKSGTTWEVDERDYYSLGSSLVRQMFGIENIFPFIEWEDEEPWKVEDLLKLEVKG